MFIINNVCKKCGKNFFFLIKRKTDYKKQYCSNKCGKAREQTIERKKIVSEKLKIIYQAKRIKKICPTCNKIFFVRKCEEKRKYCCSKCKYSNINFKDKIRKSLLNNGKIINRRSKNEILFYELCKQKFKNVLHNENIFDGWDADVILQDQKIAVLWNGIWHFKKITKSHSVEQVQNRDRIKIKKIIEKGYYPYIIEDKGSFNKVFVTEEFKKFCNFITQN